LILRTLRSWWQDRLLWGIIKNSSYLFSSNTAAMVLSMLQGIFAARLLGVEGYGIIAGVVIPFASAVHRLLSFRMSELVVKYYGQAFVEEKNERAAAVIKAASLVEAASAGLAYLVVLLVAPLAALYLAKDQAYTSLFIFYGLFLLSHSVYETSLGVLHVNRLFNRQAAINFIQSLITASLIFLAFLLNRGMWEVLLAYFLGKTFMGIAVAVVAVRTLNQTLGSGWWRVSLSLLPEWRGMARFAVSTNLHGTVNLVARDSETLFISLLRSPVEAGYFRIALTVINLVMLPIEPFIATTYAEITRTISKMEWAITRRLLKRVTAITASWTLTAAALVVALGWWLIPTIYGAEYAPSYPAALVLLVGYGFANIFNWNRTLMLALGMAEYPLKASAAAGAVKTVLTFTLVGSLGYIFEAFLLSGYFLISISLILRRGLFEFRRSEAQFSQLPRTEGLQAESGNLPEIKTDV
jgi:O-antigen/teichoic acid export membrane protein